MQKTPHGPQISSVFVALAALCWGITGGIAGLLIAKGWDPFVLSFCRGVIGLLFIACWRMLHPSGNNLANLQLWLWSVIAGIGVAGNFACYFFSIAKGSVAVGATLMYCAPVFVYLVSFGLKLEQPTPLKWAAIVVVIMGIVLLTGVYNVSASRVAPLAIGAGLLAGISYGLFIFAFKSAARFGSSQEVLLIAFAVLCILLAGTGNFQQTATLFTPADQLLLLTLGILGAGVSFIFYIIGLRNAEPTVASIVAMIEPVTASMLGVIILNQSLDALQVVGIVLILAAVTTLGRYSNVRHSLSSSISH